MTLEEIKDGRKLAFKITLISLLVFMGVNECTYRMRVAINPGNHAKYNYCMADEKDDFFVNYSNCDKWKVPKP